MTFTNEKQYLLNYGWEHFWYDPQNFKNLGIKEFVKGPFAKPKLVCSIPFKIRCQYDRTPVKFNKGIPNCCADYFSQNLRSLKKYLRNYELMQREDEDVVSHLRQYGVYVGQGIPDPWTYPYAHNLKTPSHMKEMNSLQRKHLRNKKERCLCCEREYLFECPDKCPSKAHHCPCKDCHSKTPPATDSVAKCRCSEIFHTWLLENATFDGKKKRGPKRSPSLSSSNDFNSESDDGVHSKERNKCPIFCECLRNRKRRDCYASENSGLGNGDNFCPYIKNLYLRKFFENESDKINSAEPKQSISKEIQAEIKPIKHSKTVQTEESDTKARPKYVCQAKCFPSCIYHCNRCIKAGCPVIHTIPNLICTSNSTQNPTLACPYSIENHFICQKPHKKETSERKKKLRKKKESKGRGKKERSNASEKELRLDQHDLQGDGGTTAPKSKIKKDLEEPESIETPNYVSYHKNIFNCQPPPKNFDHLKYLSDYKLKNYLQEEKSMMPGNKFIHQNSYKSSKFINFYRGNSSLNSLRYEGNPLERLRSLSSYKPKYSESSFVESKMNLTQSNIPTLNIARLNYSDQATMTSAKEVKNSGNYDLINKQVSNKVTKEECREYDYIKNQEATNVFQKRRKLLRNRKRRRKLVSSIIRYQE